MEMVGNNGNNVDKLVLGDETHIISGFTFKGQTFSGTTPDFQRPLLPSVKYTALSGKNMVIVQPLNTVTFFIYFFLGASTTWACFLLDVSLYFKPKSMKSKTLFPLNVFLFEFSDELRPSCC